MNSVSNSYINKVLKQVKFIADHRSIKRELKSHIHDLIEEHKWNSLSEVELHNRIMEEMGNPIELGKALNLVHKPLLGYAWLLSRSVFIVVLCLSTYNVAQTLINTSVARQSTQDEKLDVNDLIYAVGNIREKDYSNLNYRDWNINEVIEFDYSSIIFERIILTEENELILVYRNQTKLDLFNHFSFVNVFSGLNIYDQNENQYYPDYDVQMGMNNNIISLYKGVPFDTKTIKLDFKQVKESFTIQINGEDYE